MISLKTKAVKSSCAIAVALALITWVLPKQAGTLVSEADAATLRGGCTGYHSKNCTMNGGCSGRAASQVYLSGYSANRKESGDMAHNVTGTTASCGSSDNCTSCNFNISICHN